MKPLKLATIALACFALWCTAASFGQSTSASLGTGFPENGAFEGSSFDSVQMNNGNLHIQIPFLALPGRNHSYQYIYSYDNRGWGFKTLNQGNGVTVQSVHPEVFNGMQFRVPDPEIGFDISRTVNDQVQCGQDTTNNPPIALFGVVYSYVVVEKNGTKHGFAPTFAIPVGSSCPQKQITPYRAYATDGSGWVIDVGSDGNVTRAIDRSGDQQAVDRNGNTLTAEIPSKPQYWVLNSSTGRNEFRYYDSNGTQQAISIGTIAVPVQTQLCQFAEHCGSSNEYTATWNQPQIVQLPNNRTYQFAYEQNLYGEPNSVILPSGAQIKWAWGNLDQGGRKVVSRTVIVDGNTYQWSYSWGVPVVGGTWQNSVTDPLGNKTVYTCQDLQTVFTQDPYPACSIIEADAYESRVAGLHLVKTIKTDYCPNSSGTCTVTGVVVPIRETTTWSDTNQVSKIETDWDSFNAGGGATLTRKNVIERREFGYGTNSAGTLLRRTDYQYQYQTTQSYADSNLISFVTKTIVYDGSSNIVGQTLNTYDDYSTNHIASTSTAPANGHDYTNYGVSQTMRGNVTSKSIWRNTDGAWLPTNMAYDDLGNMISSTDPGGHTTSYSYQDNWSGASCTPGFNSYALVTQVTNQLNQRAQSTYFACTGLVQSVRNENDIAAQRTGTSFIYDGMNRVATTNYADGGQVLFDYHGDALPLTTTKTQIATPDPSIISSTIHDGLGRVKTSSLDSDPAGADIVDTTYDALGRTHAVSNPYRSTSDPTYGITQMQYDGLGRITQTIKQDGSIQFTQYDQSAALSANGNCTVTTDEDGKLRKTCTDALGRLIEVDEPGGALSSGVQATTSVTLSGAFNSTWVAAGTPHLAATGSALASVTMADGSSHNFYFDANQHLCQLWGITGSGWSTQDLSDQTNSGPALTGSALSAVFQSPAIHVFYQGANQHLYDMEWTGSAWQNLDMTVLTGATAASGTKLSTLVGLPNSPMTFYEGTDQHFYLVYWAASANVWSNAELNSGTGATTLMATNSSVSSAAYGSGLYGFYVGTNQHLITIYWNGSAWTSADLTATTGGVLAVNGSSLTASVPNVGATPLMTFYEGSNQHIYSIYWYIGNNTWQTSDFTAGTGATNVAAVVTALGNNPAGPQAFYFGTNQHLDDINWNGSAWVNTDLTSLSGSTAVPAAGSSLSSHGTSGGNTSNIFFEGTDKHIYHTYYKPSAPAGWLNEDLLTSASNYVIDSGTVSLVIPNGTSNFTATVCYGVSTNPFCSGKPINASPGDIVNALAAILNGAGSPVNAAPSGATLNLTWRTTGYNIATVAPMTSTPDNPSLFPAGSFSSTAGTFSGGQDVGSQSLTTPMVTLYSYDALGNLLHVEQHGATTDSTQWRVRTFTYNSLSQLLTATNPESGTISYTYDADGNLLYKTSPAPNQTGSATETVSYCYDKLHRLLAKGYTLSPASPQPPVAPQQCLATSPWLPNPTVVYAYDSATNGVGHLTSMTDQAGSASYSYEVLGRLSSETRTLIGVNNTSIPKTLSYEYNLAGSLHKLHYPSGAAVTYTPNSAGEMLSAVDSTGVNYVTGATYNATSAITGFVNGSGGAATITNSFSYNKRLQPITMSAATSSQTVFSIGYDFHLGNGDNGNVWNIYNYRDRSRDQSFTYDSLNRLLSAQNAGTNCSAITVNNKTEYWGNSYSYDAWGNVLGKTITKCGAENLSITTDAHNWVHHSPNDYQYDAAGNMTYDATENVSLSYDQENRVAGANNYGYIYDGDGNRVEKVTPPTNPTSGTLYWYMTPGIVAESDLTGALKAEYVFFDGERVARKDFTGGTTSVEYYFSDHLKTASVITDSAGNIKAESDYYPWGGELQIVNNDSNHYKFTGQERDDTLLDYFGARYYSNGLGRWVSADWSPKPTPVPFADLSNPQSLNLYAFVGGNPASKTDLDGHCTVEGKNHGAIWCFLHSQGVIMTAKEKKAWMEEDNAQKAAMWHHFLHEPLTKQERNALVQSGVLPGFAGFALEGESLLAVAAASGTQTVRIVEQDGSTVLLVIKGAKGDIQVVADMTKEGDTLILRGTHVEGLGKGTSSLSELKAAAKELGRSQGAKEVIVEGGVRTSGANPGKTPIPIKIKVD